MKPIWILDDDKSIRWVFEKALARTDFDFKTFSSPAEALNALNREQPQVIVSDIRMPNGSGLDFLSEVKQRFPDIPVIIMTAYSDLESAVAAFQGGAFEYLAKPFDVDQAIEIIKRAVEESMRQSVEAVEDTGPSPEIIGQAPAMQEVFRAIGRLSRSHSTVLINGESGSGKELVASALHRHSPRADKPFIAINTAAIPKDLLESELFGHERGAFTGATHARDGLVEAANGGTLLIDEVGDIPLAMQVKLLRLLETGTYRRVGSTELRHADIRVVSATHRDLAAMVDERRFREDLYYRLSTFPIALPPLRERTGDIALLVPALLARVAAPRQFSVSPAALALLERQPFPGNVRELRNLLERTTLLCDGNCIETEHVQLALDTGLRSPKALAPTDCAPARMPVPTQPLHDNALRQALARHHGSRAELASQLGISERSLYRRLRELKTPGASPSAIGSS